MNASIGLIFYIAAAVMFILACFLTHAILIPLGLAFFVFGHIFA